MLKILKLKTKIAIIETSTKVNKALIAPESIDAIIYSRIRKGVINILLKFLLHTFQSAPTDIEYCPTRTTSQSIIPERREYATIEFFDWIR